MAEVYSAPAQPAPGAGAGAAGDRVGESAAARRADCLSSSVGVTGSSSTVGKTDVPADGGGGMGDSRLGAARLRTLKRSILN